MIVPGNSKILKLIPIRAKGAGNAKILSEIISLKAWPENWPGNFSERGTASTENVHWLRLHNKT